MNTPKVSYMSHGNLQNTILSHSARPGKMNPKLAAKRPSSYETDQPRPNKGYDFPTAQRK